LCTMICGEGWLFDLLILMEIMIITVHELILKNNKILVHARKF
jgi:hypothetical protein